MQYYSSHDAEGILPEALYYAGRVKSDLGDYPVALKCYQDALDILPKSPADPTLKRRILSQTGRLLDAMSLFNEAIPYLEAAIAQGYDENDSINLINGLQLLGGIYLRDGKYDLAEHTFKKALRIYSDQPNSYKAKSKVYIAGAKLRKGEIDSALLYIHNTVDSVKPTVRNNALVYSAEIYLSAGILDSAYSYAHKMVERSDNLNKEYGYKILLNPSLRKYSSQEDIERYISEYQALLFEYYDDNQMQLAINRQNYYNYQLHVRAREKAEKSNAYLKYGIFAALLIIALVFIGILYFRNKDKKHLIELHEALDNIQRLNRELSIVQAIDNNAAISPNPFRAAPDDAENGKSDVRQASREDNLRAKLKKELMLLYEKAGQPNCLHSDVMKSEPYQLLQTLLEQKRPINNDDIWQSLEKSILQSYPHFRSNFFLLTMGKHSSQEYCTAMLIKCGFKPMQIAILLGRSPAAIGSRREGLSLKMLDQKIGTKAIDAIIRLL
ncbi:MAG: tetratricopeptide repeat protein [Clostridium sp.]|nr:tetratricopeptide repeat protein [Clostridium sp.]